MSRRCYQLGPSTFRVSCDRDGWWVKEEWSQDAGGRGRNELDESFGPFATEVAAEAFAAEGRAERGTLEEMGVVPCRAAASAS